MQIKEKISTAVMSVSMLVLSGPANAEPPTVRWNYSASDNAPDGLVFSDYLNYFREELNSSREKAVDFLVFTMELPDNATGRASAELAADIFYQASNDIEYETLVSDIAAYCPGGSETRSNDQIFEIMDRQDDEYVLIAGSAYARTIDQLDSTMRGKLQSKVARHKKSYTVAAFDHKNAWEVTDANIDMRAVVADICVELLAKRDNQ